VSDSKNRYDVHVNWPTVVPVGDTLAVRTGEGFDERWVKAFEVVLDEHRRRGPYPEWGGIDYDHATSGSDPTFALYVRKVDPAARAMEVRRTLDHLVHTANQVAQVGPHVYELARELRGPDTADASAPPPPLESTETSSSRQRAAARA
jgi:hypothetical protein